jgi:hypothetical protein
MLCKLALLFAESGEMSVVTLSALDLLSGSNCTLSLGSRKERRPALGVAFPFLAWFAVASLLCVQPLLLPPGFLCHRHVSAWRVSQVVAPARDVLPWATSPRVPRA